jgi:glucose/arabinose dehydrogenase
VFWPWPCGSLLRIDPVAQGADPYAIPGGNPFVGGGGRAEIFAYGLRNPWRFSFDRATGDLWVADVGQSAIEEINVVPLAEAAGVNFGWNRLEGSRPFEGDPPAEHVLPVFEYDRGGGCSVTGGYVYRGSQIAGLQGAYLFGDYCAGQVRALVQRDGEVVAERELGVEVPSLSSFGERADGELYALSLDGPVFRLDPQ